MGHSQYTGEFHLGKREGKGTLILADRSRYDGNFRNDWEDGEGTLYYANSAPCTQASSRTAHAKAKGPSINVTGRNTQGSSATITSTGWGGSSSPAPAHAFERSIHGTASAFRGG